MTMIETPGLVIETPSVGATPGYSDTLITDLLSHIRLSGALFLRGRFSAPWALESPGSCDLVDLLTPTAERILVFHTVRKGRMKATVRGVTVEAGPGEMIMLPHADHHIMAALGGGEPMPIGDMLPPAPWKEIPVVEMGGDGEVTEIVCGYFRCDELLFNAVLRRLPPLILVHPEGSVATLLNAAIDYALEDGSRSGGITAMDHVTEMLLRETLRIHAGEAGDTGGWLAAVSDPVVGRALKLIHDDPERDWSADGLARAANTSRSVLGIASARCSASRRSAIWWSGACRSPPTCCARPSSSSPPSPSASATARRPPSAAPSAATSDAPRPNGAAASRRGTDLGAGGAAAGLWNAPPRVNLALAAMTPCMVPLQLGADSASAMRQGTVPAVGATAVGGQDASSRSRSRGCRAPSTASPSSPNKKGPHAAGPQSLDAARPMSPGRYWRASRRAKAACARSIHLTRRRPAGRR